MAKATDAEIARQAREIMKLKREHKRDHETYMASHVRVTEAEAVLDKLLGEN